MSKKDEEKEKKEHSIFVEACKLSESGNTHLRTKSIMKFLNGEPIERKKKDRPDIINRCYRGKKEYIVGIEVFSVDQNSVKKRDKYRSKSKENYATVSQTYEKGHSQYVNTGTVSEELYTKLLKDTFKYVKGQFNSSYEDFINAFEYSYNNHAKNISEYLDKLHNLSECSNTALCFLINIEYCANDLFLNNGDKIDKATGMPFYKKMISIINSNKNTHMLDYIVFYISNPQNKTKQVIAVRTKQIKENLKKQGIVIYDYIGESLAKVSHYSVTDDTVEFYPNDISNSDIEKIVYPLYEKALKYKEGNKPFVTSRMVEMVLYVLPKAKTMKEAHKLFSEFKKLFSNAEEIDDE